jgi:hypothetical protein
MTRALFLLLVVTLEAGGTPDGGRPGAPDAGQPGDGGVAGRDGGARPEVDAGRPDAGPPASWRAFTGESLFDGGVSDLVELKVGASIEVSFPRQTVSIVCDDVTLFTLEPLVTTFRFTGLKPGHTHCGFWFEPNSFPNRYVDITVLDGGT